MRSVLVLTAYLLVSASPVLAEGSAQMAKFRQAEEFYRSGRYGVAYPLYRELLDEGSSSALVRLRFADTLWRIRGFADPASRQKAREMIVAVITETEAQGKNALWAEAMESLGDLYWAIRRGRSWPKAWSYYEKALDWWFWNRSSDADRKRQRKSRLFRIVWKIAFPPWTKDTSAYGDTGNYIPWEKLVQLLPLAETADERAGIHYLTARTFAHEGFLPEQTKKEYEEAIRLGSKTQWYDDALFHYARWWEQQTDAPGAQERALGLYRQILAEGESSQFYERAQEYSKLITTPAIKIHVRNIVPGDEASITISSRNLPAVDVTLFRVDLPNDLNLSGLTAGRTYWSVGHRRWFEHLDHSKAEVLHRWSTKGAKQGEVAPGETTFELGDALPPGAYVVQADSGGVTAREVFLISKLFLALSRSGQKVRLFLANRVTGWPLSGAKVRVWEKRSVAIDSKIQKYVTITESDGIAEISLLKPVKELPVVAAGGDEGDILELFALADYEGQLATAADPEVFLRRGGAHGWSTSVTLDRPAYCPGDTVRWQILAGKEDFISRDHDMVVSEIFQPTGETGGKLAAPLRQFGRANGTFALKPDWAPGEYRLAFSYTTRFGGSHKPMGERVFLVDERCTD